MIVLSNVLKHYENLHAIPEIGFEEVKTSAYLAERLEEAGFKVTRNVGGATGVIGIYESGEPGPTLALRADMDALGHVIDGVRCALPYLRSLCPLVDGTVCGGRNH